MSLPGRVTVLVRRLINQQPNLHQVVAAEEGGSMMSTTLPYRKVANFKSEHCKLAEGSHFPRISQEVLQATEFLR